MKQISLRMDDELHALLTREANMFNKSLTQHLLDLACKRGDLYTTNLNHRIQIHFNVTYLGDLLVMGEHSSFNGLYDNMVEAIQKGYTVVLERHYTNSIPSELRTITNLDELQKWKTDILAVK